MSNLLVSELHIFINSSEVQNLHWKDSQRDWGKGRLRVWGPPFSCFVCNSTSVILPIFLCQHPVSFSDQPSFSLSYLLQLSDSLSPLHDPCFLCLTFLGSGIQGVLERLGRLSIPRSAPLALLAKIHLDQGLFLLYKGA